MRLAVLIDADNASSKNSDSLFEEIAKLGTATVRRAYGDFSKGQAKSWEPELAKHAIVPHQQFPNVPGKNATDIALVIDAMDLLHAGGVDGFCIVSSDSDYTRLATRMRERGLEVFGFGRKVSSASFRQACHRFIEIEPPKPKVVEVAATPIKKNVGAVPKSASSAESLRSAKELLVRAFARLDGREWVPLTDLLQAVRAIQPQFTAKEYGFSKPITLVRQSDCFNDELRNGTMMVSRRRAAVAASKAA
jgi:hypothetical protein